MRILFIPNVGNGTVATTITSVGKIPGNGG